MSSSKREGKEAHRKENRFLTTRWTVVRDAGNPESSDYRAARAMLCETYWYPIYGYLRRYGCDPHESEDLTQGFLARMLDKDDFRLADPVRGKFRAFLMTSLQHFTANERKHAKRQKRGGDTIHVPIDVKNAEEHYAQEPVDGLTPEKLFERSWALKILEQAMEQLQEEWSNSEKATNSTPSKPT